MGVTTQATKIPAVPMVSPVVRSRSGGVYCRFLARTPDTPPGPFMDETTRHPDRSQREAIARCEVEP